ncbi:MAG: tRNA (adenosine(37)-N6)-threonylcarbamoyltransferase complex dimerization subunit type 1 TsaB [Alphaproteobacteria bacterium]|nr:tRNA (adenosine(37)-N6)-threonylcarbamoyltransferase complex dimerization subunit type 1 TsaB [Alphaproteobacteria bacterium]
MALRVGEQVRVRTARVVHGSDALLLPWAEELCAEAGIRLQQLDGVGVAVGPGAFTGLRVGLATASGLALALDRPAWAGSSLESRRLRAGADLALLDARKGRVYALALQDGCAQGPGDVPPEEALGWMRAPFVATGEGAVVYAAQVAAAGGRLAVEPDDPAVDTLVRLAAEGLARGEGCDAAALAPAYLRPPDAKPPKDRRIP